MLCGCSRSFKSSYSKFISFQCQRTRSYSRTCRHCLPAHNISTTMRNLEAVLRFLPLLFLTSFPSSSAWRKARNTEVRCSEHPSTLFQSPGISTLELCTGASSPLRCLCMQAESDDVSSRPPFPKVDPDSLELQCLHAGSQALPPDDSFISPEKEICHESCSCISMRRSSKKPAGKDLTLADIIAKPSSTTGKDQPLPEAEGNSASSNRASGGSILKSPFEGYVPQSKSKKQRRCNARCSDMGFCASLSIIPRCADDLICTFEPQFAYSLRGKDVYDLGSCRPASVVAALSQPQWVPGELGRRDVSSSSSAFPLGLLCMCNQTYVSSACCGAKDGLVWEDESANQLGLWLDL